LGIIGAGGVFVGSNTAYTARELNRLLTVSMTSAVVVQFDLLRDVVATATGCGIPLMKVVALDLHCPSSSFQPSGARQHLILADLLRQEEEDCASFDDQKTAKSITGAIVWTGGTGGMPKAAVISHCTLISLCVLAQYAGRYADYQIKRLISLHHFTASYSFGTFYR
jgi:long-subunit acyl-CoA synthetase (AMP-forming)